MSGARLNPTNEGRDALLIKAGEALRTNRFDEAARFAQQALDRDPNSLTAKFLCGFAYSRLGDATRASQMLGEVLTAEPRHFEALTTLSTISRESGDWERAIDLAARAVAIKPSDAQAQNNLGRCFLAGRRLEEAAAAFSQAIALQPRFAAAYYNLGKAREFDGRDAEAADAYAQAAALAPTLTNVVAYGRMLLTLFDLVAATDVARRAVEMFPESAAAHLLLCGALIETDRAEEAENHLRRAVALDVEGREALQMAARQLPLGHIDAANENLRRAIAQDPRQVSAYESLMHNQRVTERERPLIDQMQNLLSAGGLSQSELGSLHYALGKALEDLGEFESAMVHYDAANRLIREVKFGGARFDEARYARHIDQMIASLPTTGSASGTDHRSPSELPVLIVGMMRSGTTLAEQILSSHPEVAAAGEQLFWSRNWMRAFPQGQDALGQEVLGKDVLGKDVLDLDRVAELGREYVAELARLGRGASRVTDKLPGNYMFAGLIHQALPNARILHMRRHPVDTCLSIWATPNHVPSEGGHDKGNLVFVYREYLRLMRHWRSVLPPNRFLEVDYAQLVEDRERVTREMVAFCGLDWDDACLRPEANSRKVTTLSVWQVRQPVYRSSLERWRKFEPWLGEFRSLLEQT